MLRRTAEGVVKSATARGLSQFKLAYKDAIKTYIEVNKVDIEGAPGGSADYTERDNLFEYRINNPSFFSRDTSSFMETEVESTASETIIEEDSSLYKGREDEFRSRLKQPGSFRRGN